MHLQNPDLDLIRRIHPECGFYGFMIPSWICLQKRKIRFWIRKSGFGLSPKKRTLFLIVISHYTINISEVFQVFTIF